MSNNVQKVSLNFGEVLLIAFIVLKLCGVIDWSWWWVLSPFWIPLIIVIILLIIFMIFLRKQLFLSDLNEDLSRGDKLYYFQGDPLKFQVFLQIF